jgi:hypothetical protein
MRQILKNAITRKFAPILKKVWWQDATLFVYFSYFFITYTLSPSLHRLKAQWEDPPCGAEPRIELGPALQQADALPNEPRCTYTLLSVRWTCSNKPEAEIMNVQFC